MYRVLYDIKQSQINARADWTAAETLRDGDVAGPIVYSHHHHVYIVY